MITMIMMMMMMLMIIALVNKVSSKTLSSSYMSIVLHPPANYKMMVIQVQVNKLMSVFTYVCPVIDHGFRRNIVKVAVEPRGDSRVDPQTTLTII